MSVISETVNGLSMADAFRYYRDELKWHVYPVDGPGSKKEGAGKKPSVTKHWEYDPQDCDGHKWFNGSGCHNIAFAPRDKVVVVDLDSKPDKGKSVEQFLAERSELTRTPLHRTRGGAHLVYRCRDLPEWKHTNGRPYHDTLKSQISGTVSALVQRPPALRHTAAEPNQTVGQHDFDSPKPHQPGKLARVFKDSDIVPASLRAICPEWSTVAQPALDLL
jgi:Bifunctional DNA primase/polymerase, N-terminal